MKKLRELTPDEALQKFTHTQYCDKTGVALLVCSLPHLGIISNAFKDMQITHDIKPHAFDDNIVDYSFSFIANDIEACAPVMHAALTIMQESDNNHLEKEE